ncbi:MAG: TolC family protein, partial [Planctomycetes bacterium]|nr:TolC family protein [Planctomycetota bacterium]
MDRTLLLAGALLLAAGCSAPPPAAFGDRRDDWRAQEARFLPPSAAPELSGSPDLAELWAAAQRGNPGLRAAFHRWRAEMESVPLATSLPDPRLSLAGYLSQVETRVGPMQGRIGLSQAFPWFGSLQAAGDQAFAASEAAREDFEAARTRLRQSLADSWFELHYLERAVAVTEGHQELLRHLEAVSRSRYETARGEHADLIRAQVELGQVEDQLSTLRDLKRPLVERLNAALGRPVGSLLAWPDGLSPAPASLPADLAAGMARSSPELRALDARAEAARHGIVLAEKDFYPGFSLGADWTWIGDSPMAGVPDSGQDALALVVGIDLPVRRGRLDAGLSRARAREAAVLAQREDLQLRLNAELEMALYRYRDAQRRVTLYRDGLVAKSEQSFQSTLTAYQAAAMPFDSVVDS